MPSTEIDLWKSAVLSWVEGDVAAHSGICPWPKTKQGSAKELFPRQLSILIFDDDVV